MMGSRKGLKLVDVFMGYLAGSCWGCSECAAPCSVAVRFFGCIRFLLGCLDYNF